VSGHLRLTKLGHSCVRIERDGRRLVIDPGSFSDPAALDGAEAVLVTHQHPDHVVLDRLRSALEGPTPPQVWAPPDVVDLLGGPSALVHAARQGTTFEAAGTEVLAVGEWHAAIHPDIPRPANVGYLVAGTVLHPGDALTVPPAPVDVLLLPVSAPWLKLAEVIDYVRAVQPARALPIHEAVYSAAGLAVVARQLGPDGVGIGRTEYVPWVAGDAVEVALP
jgi:L-ascorbate metabolism protein UlaG (beta-lactamase superfamily)